MVKMCLIPQCKGVASKQHNIKLHKFPTSEELRHIWQERIKSFYPNFKISNNSLVCSKHFELTNFINFVRSKTFSLVKNAVPSLFDVEECVYVFNDYEQCDSFNKPGLSNMEIVQVAPGKINDSIITSSPFIQPDQQIESLDIPCFFSTDVVQITSKRMGNSINNKIRKSLFGDFEADDLNTSNKRKQYWKFLKKL